MVNLADKYGPAGNNHPDAVAILDGTMGEYNGMAMNGITNILKALRSISKM